MADIPDPDLDHSVIDDRDEYTRVRVSTNWYLMVHPEGDLGLCFVPNPNDPESKGFLMDLGFTEYSPDHVKKMIAFMVSGGEATTTH